LRLFVAVYLDPALRPAVEAVRRELVEAWPRGQELVKWVEPHNLHFTLKFLGEVDESQVQGVGAALRAVEASAPFRLHLVGLGAFPRPRGARVLWVGVGEGAAQLSRLAACVENALRPLGFPPEGRPFSPHLTIGRLRVPAHHPELETALRRNSDVEIGSQSVQSVELVQSTLRRPGPEYAVVRSYPLRGEGEG
jgi:2'-5' RNA ligase